MMAVLLEKIFDSSRFCIRNIKKNCNVLKHHRRQFSSKKDLFAISDVPKHYLEVKVSSATLGQVQVQSFRTVGAVSIVSKNVQRNQQDKLELYALNFTCKKCKSKIIRSFTKRAYSQGVVMICCNFCESIDLVADNLGWFEEDIAKISQNQTSRYDQVLIVKFIKKGFQEEHFQQQRRFSDDQNQKKSQ